MKIRSLFLFTLVFMSALIRADENIPDYKLSYSSQLLNGSVGQSVRLNYAPWRELKWDFQLEWQSFSEYEYFPGDSLFNTDVEQYLLGARYELFYDDEIAFAPVLGMTVNGNEHKASQTSSGDVGAYIGLDFSYALNDYFDVSMGVTNYVSHPIFESETALSLGITFRPVVKRNNLKKQYCNGCFYILLGSFADNSEATAYIQKHKISGEFYRKVNVASVELYLGRYHSFNQATQEIYRMRLSGTVVKR